MEPEIKEEKLGKAPEQEIKVWGLGLTNNKLDKIIELLDRQNFLLSKIEKHLYTG